MCLTGVLLETFLLALIVGFLFRGRLKNLAQTPLRGAAFIFGGLILRNIPVLFRLPFLKEFVDAVTLCAPALFLVSYVLLMIGILLNIVRWPMMIIFTGVLLNFAVVLANGGFMPVSGESLRRAGYDMSKITSGTLDMNHILTTTQTRLSFLSDIIAIPKPYPFPQIISVGDILMCLGMFVFIVIGMSPKRKRVLADRILQ